MKTDRSDICVIGAGIIGLALARELLARRPGKSIRIIEKEPDTGYHSSGRNSGVLHAGFYYTADSLKARFTREGNRELADFCDREGLAINRCGKVVVARDEAELEGLHELARRGRANGVDVSLISARELADIEPNARTHEMALHSPTTATVDPLEVCRALRDDLIRRGVAIDFNRAYGKRLGEGAVSTSRGTVEAGLFINAAGLYADRIARDWGFGGDYVIIPFKGIYLTYGGSDRPVRTNVYPVPNLNNPFLGVHFTVTVDGRVKIGPTAIPAFWRENYRGLANFSPREAAETLYREADLFARNSFGFRDLAFEEMRKYRRSRFVGLAAGMVHGLDRGGFREWSRPGIRAQLMRRSTRELLQDFVVEGDGSSVHILNAVSPAFTGSFPFCRWVVETHAGL